MTKNDFTYWLDSLANEAPTSAAAAAGASPASNASFTLTANQENALQLFSNFLFDPAQKVMVIEGYSGTGKSTLLKAILEKLADLQNAMKLVDEAYEPLTPSLTATTNKAASALWEILQTRVVTIHSFMGLRVGKDLRTGKTTLNETTKDYPSNTIVFIDEASYIDTELLDLIHDRLGHLKVVFLGDPAQLTAVNCNRAPVFSVGYPTARLTQVMRQRGAGHIAKLSEQFRSTVENGRWLPFKPDGREVKHLEYSDFVAEIKTDYAKGNEVSDLRVLTWTNSAAIFYNNMINELRSGVVEFKAGDYAVNNHFVITKSSKLSTDQLVCIANIGQTSEYGVPGYCVELMGYNEDFFVPSCRKKWKDAIASAKALNADWATLQRMEQWLDLRPPYSSTINKAQGSTYRKVFIDLGDLSRCNNGNQLARLLYVGVSRASEQVILTGDFA